MVNCESKRKKVTDWGVSKKKNGERTYT